MWPRGKPVLPSGGRPCGEEEAAALGTGAWPPDAPGGCPCVSLPRAAPRLTLTPVTSTAVPGHLPSRDCPGPCPWCPPPRDRADGSWHTSGAPLLRTRGSHQAEPLSSLWGGAVISSILQMRKLRLREGHQGPAKPPPPVGTAWNLSLPTAASGSRCLQAMAPRLLLASSSRRPPPHRTFPRTPSTLGSGRPSFPSAPHMQHATPLPQGALLLRHNPNPG